MDRAGERYSLLVGWMLPNGFDVPDWRSWSGWRKRRKGAPLSLVVAVPIDTIELTGDLLRIYHGFGDSGLRVKRRFCGACSSPVLSFMAALLPLEFIRAGLLDDMSWLGPSTDFWRDTTQSWLHLGDPLANRATALDEEMLVRS